ncbi:hypothetical protein [Streptomyces avermitilis]|uniref:hypothetical protein n=1 Tax=Streptomyces avermitilis TaxID=33903 RepID=UPI0037193F3E
MVVLMSQWPQVIWAMCGGMPFVVASVTKIRAEVVGLEAQGLAVLVDHADGG